MLCAVHRVLNIRSGKPKLKEAISDLNQMTPNGSDEEGRKLSNLKLLNRLQDFRMGEFSSCVDTIALMINNINYSLDIITKVFYAPPSFYREQIACP